MRLTALHPTRLAAIVAVLVAPVAACAQTNPDPLRFESEIALFREYDVKNTSPSDAVLFVGSSSIRLWHTSEAFPDATAVNRGFGGAHISDVNYFLEETVLKYRPAAVFFYAGDNDVWDGKKPERVKADFDSFLEAVWARRPDTEVYFISIKPSPSRWSVWEQMSEANALIAEAALSEDRLTYLDIASPMLGTASYPDSSLFAADMLHLNEKGYDLWEGVVAPHVRRYGRE